VLALSCVVLEPPPGLVPDLLAARLPDVRGRLDELSSAGSAVEVVDPHRVRFRLKQPWPDFMTFYATPATGAVLAQKASQRFPNVTIAAQGYLVIAGDGRSFREKYPTVTNYVAAWTPKLANSGEQITLRNSLGDQVDQVRYSNEGDWGLRTRGEKAVASLTASGNVVTVNVPYHSYVFTSREQTIRIAGATPSPRCGKELA